MRIIATLLFICISFFTSAQAPFIEWNVTNNNPNIMNSLESPGGITALADGGYIFTGSTTENTPYDDIVNVKIDSRGNTVWKRKIGFNYNERTAKVRATADGGFVNICSAEEGGTGFHYRPYPQSSRNFYDLWIAKSDANGSLLWERDFGSINSENGYDIRELADGSFIAVGSSGAVGDDVKSHAGGGDLWVIKVSATGTLLWSKSFGTALAETGLAVIITNDGNCVVAGKTGTDGYIVKVNTATGDLIWSQTVTGAGTEIFYGVTEDATGNLIFSGNTNSTTGIGEGNRGSTDVWVYKTTSTGSMIWSKVFGSAGADNGYTLVANADESVTVVCKSAAASGDVTNIRGGTDTWVINVSKEGNLTWEKAMGSTASESGVDITKGTDGGHVLLSYTNQLYTNADITCPKGYLWVVKLSSTANTFPANPILWLKADAGVTAAGGTVSNWADQSGLNYNATVPSGTTGPQLISNALNGRPVLRFAGAQGLITTNIANFGCRNQMDVFVVMKKQTSATEQSVLNAWNLNEYSGFEIKGNLQGASSCYNCQADNGFAASMTIQGQKSVNATFSGLGSTNCFSIIEAKFSGNENGDEAQLFIDNNRVPRTLGTDNANSSGIFDAVPMSLGYKTITGVKSNFLNGDVAEIIMFSAALSDSARYAVYNSLYQKYFNGNNAGFTAPVAATNPSDAVKFDGQWKHPFKTSLPNNQMVALQDKCNELSNLSATTYVEATPIYTAPAGDQFMRRHYTIQTTGNGRVRLYFTQAEFDDYAAVVGGITSIKDLEIVRYTGPTEDGVYDISDVPYIATLLPDSSGQLYGANYIESSSSGKGEYWLRKKANVLPLTLLNFQAKICSKQVCLQWQTAAEVNTKTFEIWKSKNGRDFVLLNNQQAVGHGENTYNAVDDAPANGNNYYQLRMIDMDGQFTKSNIVQVKLQSKPAISLYPNPVHEVMKFQNIAGVKTIQILAADGRLLLVTKPGLSGEINVAKLSSGFYIARLITDGEVTVLNFIKR